MKRNYFNYKKIKDKYLLTNDLGRYIFLTKDEFLKFITDRLKPEEKLTQLLEGQYFLYEGSEYDFVEKAGAEFREYRRNLFQGASLHIFVLTKQCNQQCVYCQASTDLDRHTKMSFETAQKAVDIALQAPSHFLTFEFQGGEPLMNFETLKYIVEYTRAQETDKEIQFSLVSNLMLLDEEKLEFLTENQVSICTSLDGDEFLHNKNRPYLNRNAFKVLEKRLQRLRECEMPVSAIQTTTRYSLTRYKELADQYYTFDLNQIIVRPLTPLGYAKDNWDSIGYTVEEFLDFYRKIFEYILEMNRQGKFMIEGHARIFLDKLFNHDAGNYMELRSPCGGAIGQLAYYYNGKVYSCDEARMLAEMGDDSFCLGNVYDNDYIQLMSAPACKVLANASCLEGLTDCCDCVYHPYCGTCPVISYARYKTVYPRMEEEYRCSIYKGIQDILFEKLYENDEQTIEILKSWCQ